LNVALLRGVRSSFGRYLGKTPRFKAQACISIAAISSRNEPIFLRGLHSSSVPLISKRSIDLPKYSRSVRMDNLKKAFVFFEEANHIKNFTKERIEQFNETIRIVLESNETNHNWEGIVGRFSNAEAVYQDWLWTCELMAKVGSEEVRKESNESLKAIKDILTETWAVRIPLFSEVSAIRSLSSIQESGAEQRSNWKR
jgi:hypothetical protein